jgi:hypothetical protein
MLALFVRRCLLPPLCLFAATLLLTRSEASQNVTFQWDPSPEPNVVLYRLYVGTSSRAYIQSIQVAAPTTRATAPDLSDGQHYYFAVTAVTSDGVESGYSLEVDYIVPGTAPLPQPNAAPTLNALDTLVLAQNSSMKTVSLTGISSGSSTEIQPLLVTAVTSNPLLVPIPAIFYLSPNVSGALSFTPLVNTWGTASVIVTVNDGQLANNSVSKSFLVVVNNPPTLDPLANVTINQDAAMQTISLTGISSGAPNEAQPLQITASSSNPALIPTPGILYFAPNTSGALVFKPAAGQTGTATISVTVNDGQAGNNMMVRTFTVTVNPVAANIAPTLNGLGNVVISQNSGTTSVAVSGITSGSSSETQALALTASSSNPALIPTPAVSYASPNSTGTLAFAPAANMSGSATITVTVSDGQSVNGTTTRSFVVTVNNPPTLNPLSNVSISQGSALQTVALGGIASGASSESQTLQITASSSNPALIPTPSILYSSPNSSGALTFKPAASATGSAVITVTVNDGQAGSSTTSRSFTVTVNAVAPNIAPTLNAIGNFAVTQNWGPMSVPLSGITSGSSSEVQTLTVTASSSNPALIPTPGISYTSPNSSGSISFAPAANVSGTAAITVTVSDGQAVNGSTSRSFSVTVNNYPTLNPLGNLSINQDAPVQTVVLSGISSGASSEAQTLVIAATSSNPGLIPTPSISYASPNATGTLSFKPAAGASGSSVITLSVSDGQAGNSTTARSFTVTVNPVAANIAPTLNTIGNYVITQNSAATTVPLSGITSGSSSEVQPLTVTATSSNPGLIPNPGIAYTSPNSIGSLVFAPAANVSGSATITVTVSDGQALNRTVTRSFTVTVNNLPTLNSLSNLSINQDAALQTVALSGISSGAASEGQSLQVTASSSNPSLIPTPSVLYTSPNASGALTFKPAAGGSGSAVITVSVNDGQAGNSTVSRSFTLTVNAVAPNVVPTLNVIGNVIVAQNSGTRTVSLSGISSGSSSEVQSLAVTATSSNPALIPNPNVSYISPNATGSLSFTPTLNASGTATITVTVSDGQALNSTISRSFVVTVNPAAPNVAPTLNALGTVAVTQNSGARNILLSGISSGSSTEVQPLSVVATSSNPALIPTPVITYSSPNSTGNLAFTPAPNVFGTATITVTVSDGQALNRTVSRAFTVIVNNPPTLNQPLNMTIPVNSRSQAVSLTGISSGAANEVQPLTVTAASSNTGLIPTPAIFYSSPNANAAVYFTPVTNVTGSATITVTVRDGQAGNNVVSRSFVVTVSASMQSLSAFSVEGESSGELPPEDLTISPGSETTASLETIVNNETPSEIIQPVEQQTIIAVDPPATEIIPPADSPATESTLPPESSWTEILPPAEANVPPPIENQETAPAPGIVGPQISGLVVTSSDARTLVISWQTDQSATCLLEFGGTHALEWISESTVGTTHTVTLQNLQPATVYYMRVQAADAENHFTVTEISTVETPAVNVLAWEAENAEMAEPMSIDQELEAGGEVFISTATSGIGTATFNLDFPQGMSYRVWCRVKTIGGSGQVALSIDGSGEALATVPDDGSGTWHWVSLTVGAAPVSFLANDGFHRIVLRGITVDTRLDKICISNDPEWQPVNFRFAPTLTISRALGAAVLEWTDPWSNAEGYVIESSADGYNFQKLDIVESTERSYNVSGAQGQKTYYRIYAFNELDRGASSAVVSLISEHYGAPNAPENVAAQLSDEGQIVVMWTDTSSDESGFVLERSTDRYNFSIVQRVGADSNSVTDTPPGPGRYYYRVRAVSDEAKSEPTDSLRVLF